MTDAQVVVISKRPRGVTGAVRVPGDKSISHRAAMLSGLALGQTTVTNFGPGMDCTATLYCLEAMGVRAERSGDQIVVHGVGLDGLHEPSNVLDCMNAGTSMRLLSGILAGQGFLSVLTGDASLRSRPMKRITEPLRRMGARIDGRGGGSLAPLVIRGPRDGICGGLTGLVEYKMPVASAQVKSSLMLAGLYADGATTIIEPAPSRDHTERMLSLFGAEIKTGDCRITVKGSPVLRGRDLAVPGDLSSASFWLAAAAIVPGSDVVVSDVGLNPLRAGFLRMLGAMGCRVDITNVRDDWEPVGDVRVRSSDLRGIDVPPEEIPALLDEVPVLGVCGAMAEGRTRVRGAGELRHKESDRIRGIVENLRAMGADAGEEPDGFWVQGRARLQGALIHTAGDHRIAMAFAVAALVAGGRTVLDDAACIDVSYPGFLQSLDRLTGERTPE